MSAGHIYMAYTDILKCFDKPCFFDSIENFTVF